MQSFGVDAPLYCVNNVKNFFKTPVDKGHSFAYNTSQQEKPMSKRSNRKGYRKESRGWWDHGGEAFGEWTCEGGANRETSVVADGDRTRYQGGTYGCT